MNPRASTPLFCQAEFHQVVAGQHNRLKEEVNNFSEEYLADVSDAKLVSYLVDRNSCEAPSVGEPFIESNQEVKVDVRHDFRRMIRDRSKPFYVTGHRIEVHLPFTGLPQLLNVAPSTRSPNPPAVHEIGPDYLSFVFEGVELDPKKIKEAVDEVVGEIKRHLDALKADCERFNSNLESLVRQLIAARRAQFSKKRKLVEEIGLPNQEA